jgi:hypothetical protein
VVGAASMTLSIGLTWYLRERLDYEEWNRTARYEGTTCRVAFTPTQDDVFVVLIHGLVVSWRTFEPVVQTGVAINMSARGES